MPILIAPGVLSHAVAVDPAVLHRHVHPRVANTPVDAGRLEVMHHRLCGRAEGVRKLARTWTEAVVPLACGGVAAFIVGHSQSTLRNRS